jgi:DNA ligase 1
MSGPPLPLGTRQASGFGLGALGLGAPGLGALGSAGVGLGAERRVMIELGEGSGMQYQTIAEAYHDLERVTSRLALTDRLAVLLAGTPGELLPVVCYLCQGLIAPEFAGVDLGLAEKLAIRAVATATGTDPGQVAVLVREVGDLGQGAEQLLAATADGEAGADRGTGGLTVTGVVDTLHQIAAAEGQGSQGRKLDLLAGLLAQATPLAARYLLRLVTKGLRLGIGTPTILDALAQVYAGGRGARPVLERGYNICCDLGLVAAVLADGGLAAVEQLRVQPGRPVRVMLAQRLADATEILAKLGGQCAAEYKYDGVRVQAHRTADGAIELFTRRLERVSAQFPDVVESLAAGLGPREAILEGEVVAYDAAAGELRPFGEVMFRRRKHGIDQAVREVPVGLFCFELLYADGQDLTRRPYPQRRAALAAAVTVTDRLRLTTATGVDDPAALDAVFEQAVTDGCEGLVCKAVGPDAVYAAGARGWQWIKLKRDYRTELSDTVDLVIVGAFAGRGRRAGVYGAVLMAAYDPAADVFRAVTKCGAGFSDADLAALPARLASLAASHRPARVDARAQPDVWFEPGLVLEVLSAELTLSPNYTAAWGQLKPDRGLAMRFPRFTGRWRDDKAPEDATTTGELAELYGGARPAPAPN